MAVTSNKISKTGEHILTASMPVGITCRKMHHVIHAENVTDFVETWNSLHIKNQ